MKNNRNTLEAFENVLFCKNIKISVENLMYSGALTYLKNEMHIIEIEDFVETFWKWFDLIEKHLFIEKEICEDFKPTIKKIIKEQSEVYLKNIVINSERAARKKVHDYLVDVCVTTEEPFSRFFLNVLLSYIVGRIYENNKDGKNIDYNQTEGLFVTLFFIVEAEERFIRLYNVCSR